MGLHARWRWDSVRRRLTAWLRDAGDAWSFSLAKRSRSRKQQARAKRKTARPAPLSREPSPPSRGPAAPLYLAFFLSGFAGLMHEVVWEKQLMLLTGAAAYAQAAVLAVFMGGLALGSVLFGRWVDGNRRPLRAYLVLEIATGCYCLFLPLIVF